MNGRRLALVIIIVAVAVAAALYFAYMFGQVKLDEAKSQELLATGTYREGVSIGGVDVSGLTKAEAGIAISPIVNRMLNAGQIEFTVQGVDAPYQYSLTDMGLVVDPEPVLDEAMLYGREGTRWSLKFDSPEPRDFQLQRTFNIGNVEQQVKAAEEADEWGEPVINGRYRVETTKDESSLQTGGTLVETEPQDGYAIDTDSIISTIETQIMDENYEPFEAPVEILKSQSVDDAAEGELRLMGQKTTNFASSDSNRKYNIWKMASILNGAVLEPGETFSVNDTAGDRNAENGWKEGNGIENGQYTPQYGGGICQVSSTLYNACLMAELEMVNRVPHTIAASYVPKGLDATISTGGPDFKFKNTYGSPIYVVIKTDGYGGQITAQIWGNDPRDYRVEIYSEEDTSQREDIPPVEYQRNSSLSSNSVQLVRKGQPKEVWNVYKDKIDRETENVIESKIFVTKSTYNAISPLYEVGSGISVPSDGTPVSSLGGNVSSSGDGIQADPGSSGSSENQGSSGSSGNQGGSSSTQKPSPTQKPNGGGSSQTQSPSTPAPTDPPSQADPPSEPDPPQQEDPPDDGGSEVA